jgi:riboflavin kinase / FMN adenylyltransferase
MRVVHGLGGLPHGCPRPVVTIGNFDGLHRGHQQLMRDLVARAVQSGGTSTVLTFHPHPLQLLAPGNAPRQIQTLHQKLVVMESLGIELVVVLKFDQEFAGMSAACFVEQVLCEALHVHEVYVGPNFAFGNRREGGVTLLKEIGEARGFVVGKIHEIRFRGTRVSSTAVRRALIDGHVALARRLLGRPFELEGEVVQGSAVGAGIGVRTANLRTPNELIPRKGVYVSFLVTHAGRFPAVTNVGVRPTITGGGETSPVSIETHVLDFQDDLYGRQVRLQFLTRLREERRFAGPEALLGQIRRDIGRARRYFAWLGRAETAESARGRPRL